jgi:hypothetical protein
MSGEGNGSRSGSDRFGGCCEELREAMEDLQDDGIEPLITVGPDGILYCALGLVDHGDEGRGTLDCPIYYCPFCGTKLQDPEVVQAQISSEGELRQ